MGCDFGDFGAGKGSVLRDVILLSVSRETACFWLTSFPFSFVTGMNIGAFGNRISLVCLIFWMIIIITLELALRVNGKWGFGFVNCDGFFLELRFNFVKMVWTVCFVGLAINVRKRRGRQLMGMTCCGQWQHWGLKTILSHLKYTWGGIGRYVGLWLLTSMLLLNFLLDPGLGH